MNEMFIKLRTKFMKKIVSKLLTKGVQNKLGYKVNIQIDDLEAELNNGEITLNVKLEAKMNEHEFIKILKAEDLD